VKEPKVVIFFSLFPHQAVFFLASEVESDYKWLNRTIFGFHSQHRFLKPTSPMVLLKRATAFSLLILQFQQGA
jgi:hypothetical protein